MGSHVSPELFQFFRELALNNERDWFQANKARYEATVQGPLLRLIEDLRPHLQAISPHYRADARKSGGSLFRIYNDVRFSKGVPYKTHAGIQLRHEAGKDAHAPGFYIHLEPGSVFVAGGLWRPKPAVAQQIREAIAEDPSAWTQATTQQRFASGFKMGGDSLKRAPRGFSEDHPLIEDLKRKDFIASHTLTEDDACAPGFVDQLGEELRTLAPLMALLTGAVGLPF